MERAAERGEALTDQQYQRLASYQATTEYQSEKAVWRTFGDAIFG